MTVELSRRTVLSLGVALPFLAGSAQASRAAAATARPEAITLPAGASAFVSVTPTRLADTRPEFGVGGFTPLGGNTIRVQIAGRGGVPTDATAAVLNVTAVNTIAGGYVTVFPAGTTRPEASNLNIERAGQIIPNLVTVRLGSGTAAGAVDIFTQYPCDLVVDVNGAYAPVSGTVAEGRFVALESAFRVIDTRERGSKVAQGEVVRVGIEAVVPPGASAVVVNLTVTESNGAGFWTAFPAGGAFPPSSSVNTDGPNQTRANQAILPVSTVGTTRGIDVFSAG
ncbi:MAG: hypothetical protein ABIW84_07445, partial [Ilumatobacteraceae bacterium]